MAKATWPDANLADLQLVSATLRTATLSGVGRSASLQEQEPGGWYLSGKTYGSPSDEEGFSFDQTQTNGLLLFGTTNGYGVGLTDFLLIKTDSIGLDYAGTPIDIGTTVTTYEDTSIEDAPVQVMEIDYNPGLIKIYPVPISNLATIDISDIANHHDQFSFILFNDIGQVLINQRIKVGKLTFS
ncbi:MAG: hypothetical protein IIB38_00985, partial [Candidatus Hydrogenedentes bacterium]|nr:hypothetical protein [Candidatus Hydrogenedentota bacterium]